MPFYQKNGKIPIKRHVQFRNQSNDLIWEELVSRNGFSGIYSNLYHRNPPTAIREIGKLKQINLNSNMDVHRHHHFKTRKIKLGGDLISSRVPLLLNDDLVIYKAHIDRSMKNLYKMVMEMKLFIFKVDMVYLCQTLVILTFRREIISLSLKELFGKQK